MSEELESSLKSPLGQLEEIKRCKQHPDMILSGRHRWKILNTVGKTASARFIDCEAKAKELGVSHDFVHWLVVSGSNIRRGVPEDEQKADLLQMANILERDEIARELRVEAIAHFTGLSIRRVQQLLPPEHKREYKSETVSQLPENGGNGNAGDTAQSAASPPRIAEPEGHVGGSSPPSPLHGEDASKHRISAYTEAEQLFAGNLNYFGIEYRTQETFLRPEFTDDHKPKTYVLDFYLPKQEIGIELEGEGSASADNEARDKYFKAEGVKIVHLPNALAKKYGAQIAELIAVLT